MTHHFFIPSALFNGNQFIFPSETAHQIQRVLRLRDGEMVIVLDNMGYQYDVRLVGGESFSGLIETKHPARGEPATKVWLYLSLSQREKFEWVLQKGTELGVSGYVPMVTQRTLVQDGKSVEKKRERWESILKEASEQCGRGRIPILTPAMAFQKAVVEAKNRCDEVYFPWVGESTHNFRTQLKIFDGESLAIFIGPEGGFAPEEVEYALASHLCAVSLGTRVMRMETAALAAVTMAMFELGELD